MPKFLDFVFTFKPRETPHSQAWLRCEDDFGPINQRDTNSGIQPSDTRIQHCFNILGIEPDKKNPGAWLQRQVAAYHTFDLLNGTIFWIIMKGDDTIKDRMQQNTDKVAKSQSGNYSSAHGSFAEALREHLLLLSWGVENWSPHLESLEQICEQYTKVTRYPRIQELVDDTPIRRLRDRAATMESYASPSIHSSEQDNNVKHRVRHMLEPALRRAASSFNVLPRRETTNTDIQMMRLKDDQLELDSLVSFHNLQKISSLVNRIHDSISLIDQNSRVFADIRTRYSELEESALFKTCTKDLEQKARMKSAIDSFVTAVRQLEGQLDSFRDRLHTLLRRAEQADDMYDHIFQARNTRTTEFFAAAANESADSMQKCTEEMQLKTISMHVITIFTLIFLPGTFVATMFSSGIITFGNEGSSGFGPNLGDWEVRVAGLKLFFLICVPLLALTLSIWALSYTWQRRKATIREFLRRYSTAKADSEGVHV
ncbi:hypothetical protein NLU13_3920 [Sarocladium strictum]|uniref:CorA-like transporter domain-containing protein n=1 Tax=Sarocladium strictum TaxID=5046 RepID=A0AA39GHX7_SARSR|nr:hypothetical protein NLU13_3920 [Sarocladium strictum]